jgi:ketosteroid isomerase-like protein
MNKYRHDWSIWIYCTLILMTACTTTQTAATLKADEIRSLGTRCEELYAKHIDAWNSRVTDNLRLVYTDDIVHFDGEPVYIGIDAVAGMAKDMFSYFPDWQMQVGDTYVSKNECLGTWINWGLLGLTQDFPGTEYDLMDTRGDKFSYWRVYYGQRFYNAFAEYYRIKPDFLSAYAAAWTSGDIGELGKLYSEDATLEDSLYGVTITGTLAIQDYATSFFTRSPGASWTLLTPFAEERSLNYPDQYPHPAQGGIYGITVKDSRGKPCEIRSAVILTPDENGIILAQKMFYTADTLFACGWAE